MAKISRLRLLLFISSLLCFSERPAAETFRWSLSDSPITISEDFLVLPDDQLLIDSGVQVLFQSDTRLIVRGSLNIEAGAPIRFSAFSGDSWGGVNVQTDADFVVQNLEIESALIGLEIVSSAGVSVINSNFSENEVGISLFADDGFRYRKNVVENSTFVGNGSGIRAHKTGLIALDNAFIVEEDAVRYRTNKRPVESRFPH
jgi:hypothetical protein